MGLSAPSQLLATGQTGFTGSSFTTGSFTTSNNSLLVAFVSTANASGITLGNIAASGWTVQASVKAGSGTPQAALHVLTQEITTGGSMTLTVSGFTANAANLYDVEIYSLTGHNTSTPVGATATGTNTATGAVTITLSSAPASSSYVLAGKNTIFTFTGTQTEGSGWTSLYKASGTALAVEQQSLTGTTSTSVPWQAMLSGGVVQSGEQIQIAIEILASIAVNLSASALSAVAGWLAPLPKIQLASQALVQADGRGSPLLSARISAASQGVQRSVSGMLPSTRLSAQSFSDARATAAVLLRAPLSAFAAVQAAGRLSFGANILLGAAARATARAASGLLPSIRLSAQGFAKYQGAAIPLLRAFLSAATAAQASGWILSGVLLLKARMLATVSGRLPVLLAVQLGAKTKAAAQANSSLLGRLSLAASTKSAGVAKASLLPLLRLAASGMGAALVTSGFALKVFLMARGQMASGSLASVPLILSAKLVAQARGYTRILLETSFVATKFISRAVSRKLAASATRKLIAASPARNRIAQGTSLLSVAPDFYPPIDATVENEFLTFDFGPVLSSGATITSVVSVTAIVVSGSDATPASRLQGSSVIAPSPATLLAGQAVRQLFGGAIAGSRYRLQCVVATSDGQQLSLFAHIDCAAPL